MSVNRKKTAPAAQPAAEKPAPAATPARKPAARKPAAAPAKASPPAEAAVAQARTTARVAPIEQPLGKPARPEKPVKAAKPAKGGKPSEKAADKAPKARKAKLVRDSFTMPDYEYAQIAALKKRLLASGVEAKKSEVLRAGIVLLAGLNEVELVAAVGKVEVIKTGRPAKAGK